jgi:hypothetical protein
MASAMQIAGYAHDAGWSGTDLVVAVAVALAESSGNPAAHALTAREDSRGLWQVNVRAHPEFGGVNLYDPKANAQAAHAIWAKSGWGPWSAHNTGAYLLYMPIASGGVSDYYTLNPGKGAGDAASAATPQPVKDAAAAALTIAQEPVRVLKWLTQPGTQVRIGKVIVGGGLVMIGLFLFARPAVQPVVDTVAKTAGKAAL